MAKSIDSLLKQAEKFEKMQDYSKLSETYREIAKYYYKQKDMEMKDIYLNISRLSKNIIEVEYEIQDTNNLNEATENKEKLLNIQEQLKGNYLKQLISMKEFAKTKNKIKSISNSKEIKETIERLKSSNIQFQKMKIIFSEIDELTLVYNELHHYYKDNLNIIKIKTEIDKLLEKKKSLLKSFNELEQILSDSSNNFDINELLDYDEIIEMDEEYKVLFSDLYLMAAANFSELKLYDKAKQYVKKTMDFTSNNEKVYFVLGSIYLEEENDLQEAINNYNKAIEINPKFVFAYCDLAYTLSHEKLKQYEKAKEYYEKALKIDSKFAQAHNNLAFLLAEHFNEYKLAQEHYIKAIEIEPNLNEKNFISEIKIKKVRHLQNIDIKLSDVEPRHLIITGKNGCGKTSLLDECRNNLKKILEIDTQILFSETFIKEFLHPTDYKLKFTVEKDIKDLRFKYDTGNFIVAYFPATRHYKPQPVSPVNIVRINKINKIDDLISERQLLGYMSTNVMLSTMEDEEGKIDTEAKGKFNKLKTAIENGLREIYDDPQLIFKFKRSSIDTVTAEITTKGREPFLLDQLADGYASIFNIYSELLLRMSHFKTDYLDMEGMVLIDEPEDHLHLEIQKKMLPFLTKMFPRLQFIVATHSPFIVSSLPNAVVYDLEKKWRFENASELSYSGLVENFFKVDSEYSELFENKVKHYEELVNIGNWTEEKEIELAKLDTELKNISPLLSPEMYLKVNNLHKKLEE